MKLLRVGSHLINPECISQVCINPYYSQVKVCLSCSNSTAGTCAAKDEGKLEKLSVAELEFIGEEAEALKSYFTDSQNVTIIS
jgi:hypothetical protein